MILKERGELMGNELVILKGNRATTTSLKVAEVFEKRHDNVMQAINNLDCSNEFRLLNFKEVEIIEKNGIGGAVNRSYYEMTRDGFTFLAMGFTGKKAAQWKEKYITAFNAMEAGLMDQASQPRELTRLELIEMAMESEKARLKLETENRRMLPKVESFETFLDTKGHYTLREAFKTLGQKPNVFTKMLRAEGVLYYLHGNNIPKQEYLDRGYFEVKVNTNERLDKSFSQTYVTPKGMGWLRRRFVHIRPAARTGCGACC